MARDALGIDHPRSAVVVFDVVSVQTEHLDEWAGMPSLKAEHSYDDDGRVETVQLGLERRVLDTAEIAVGRVEVSPFARSRT